jgi:hypothetical protein
VPRSVVAARALGQIFASDTTVLIRHAVRPMADAWVGWSVKWTRRFGEEWARARQLPTGTARLLQVLRLQTPLTQNHWRRRSMSTSARSAGAAATLKCDVQVVLLCAVFSFYRLVMPVSSGSGDAAQARGY